jgi:hypothetical protein
MDGSAYREMAEKGMKAGCFLLILFIILMFGIGVAVGKYLL